MTGSTDSQSLHPIDAGCSQPARQVARPGFRAHPGLGPFHLGYRRMVHFPVIPVTDPVSSEAQITTARGEHLLTLGAGDMPSLLKQAMPLLPWGTAGGDTTLPYCEFLSLLLVVMWVDEDGVDKSLSGSIIADSALHRVWTELRKGFTDVMWVGQTRGQFLLTLSHGCRVSGRRQRAVAAAGW